MQTHWFADGLALYNYDCREVLPVLADASVDSVVTDPPYGLEFMGKEWDALGRDIGKAKNRGMGGIKEKGMVLPESYNADVNVRCRACGKWRKDHAPRRCSCAQPDFPNYRAHQAQIMQGWHHTWAAECFRVLKPGGYLLAFGGTRTYHRLASAIEDAGFEIRDSLHWLYGSGFPKSLDVSKAIDKAAGAQRDVVGRANYSTPRMVTDQPSGAGLMLNAGQPRMTADITAPATPDAARWEGWGTALKPAHEPIVLARKPLTGTVAANVLAHGTGALNVDGCRVGSGGQLQWAAPRDMGYHGGTDSGPVDALRSDAGRWPPNVLLTHAADCDGQCAPGCPVAGLDGQSGVLGSGVYPSRRGPDQDRQAYGSFSGQDDLESRRTEKGGASRFFPQLNWSPEYDLPFLYQAKASAKERPRHADGSAHPTVKPLALMRWLTRLVTPPGGTVLDPFCGTGTTLQAARLEGFRSIGCDSWDQAAEMACQRLGLAIEADAG